MIIANPLFDTTFKFVLENVKVAKFLIGTILDCEILHLEPSVIERTYEDKETKKIHLFRRDYAATIVSKTTGKEKVLIELQKAQHEGDIQRFRRYVGKEYIESVLPIISIFILGFNLPVDSVAFLASPECIDLLTQKKLDANIAFIKSVTHKAYFIQTLRIKASYDSKLEKLLTVFEQANFTDTSKSIKSFDKIENAPEIDEMVKILQYVAADKSMKKILEDEAEYHIQHELLFGEKERKIADQDNKIREKEQIIEAKVQIIEEKEHIIGQQEQTIARDKSTLMEKDNLLSEQEQKIMQTAKALKKMGMSVKEISDLTGLSVTEIEEF